MNCMYEIVIKWHKGRLEGREVVSSNPVSLEEANKIVNRKDYLIPDKDKWYTIFYRKVKA